MCCTGPERYKYKYNHEKKGVPLPRLQKKDAVSIQCILFSSPLMTKLRWTVYCRRVFVLLFEISACFVYQHPKLSKLQKHKHLNLRSCSMSSKLERESNSVSSHCLGTSFGFRIKKKNKRENFNKLKCIFYSYFLVIKHVLNKN